MALSIAKETVYRVWLVPTYPHRTGNGLERWQSPERKKHARRVLVPM